MLRRISSTALTLVLVAATPLVARAGDEVTREDVAAADAERRATAAQLGSLAAEYDAGIVRSEELEAQLQKLAVELAVRERELALTRAQAEGVVRKQYMTGGDTGVMAVFGAESFGELAVRHRYLDLMVTSDAATMNRLAAVKASYQDQAIRLERAFSEQEALTASIELVAARLLEELTAANERYDAVVARFEEQEARRLAEEQRRKEEEARRLAAATSTTTTPTTAPPAATTAAPDASTTSSTTAAPTTTAATTGDTTTSSTSSSTTAAVPPTTTAAPTTTTAAPTTTTIPPPPPDEDAMVCPVDGAVAFTDTWGAARSGGRSHQGVDIIAARGTPVVAVEAGIVFRLGSGGLGGITVWLRADDGDEYYYAHLDGWAPGLQRGDRLPAGGALGTVGNTGNARYTIPHLHFEYHPDGGSAVNPYPLAAELCL